VAKASTGAPASLCTRGQVPTADIDTSAPFATAFLGQLRADSGWARRVFLATSARFVSFGAVTGARLPEPGAPFASAPRSRNAEQRRGLVEGPGRRCTPAHSRGAGMLAFGSKCEDCTRPCVAGMQAVPRGAAGLR